MPKVTIDGKEYDTETFSEDARNNMLNTKYCDDKLAELKREIAIVQTARNAYAQALQRELPKDA
jgi:hypothetical protein